MIKLIGLDKLAWVILFVNGISRLSKGQIEIEVIEVCIEFERFRVAVVLE